ncbi:hypothetical protein PF003_g14623 [Phytophthora fragariae]|nr:hypothetical protein PF003_g14623 [Phytophthora fragariae]
MLDALRPLLKLDSAESALLDTGCAAVSERDATRRFA